LIESIDVDENAILEGFCGAIVGDMGMCLFTGDGKNTAGDMSKIHRNF
jgi:hypothetical protein